MVTNETAWLATLSPAERRELSCGSRTDLLPTPDVLIVGGGIIGLAAAYFLADRGARVQLVEAGEFASGASGANAGGVWPNDQGPSHSEGFQQLAFLSRDLWGRLSLRPGFEFDWRVNGFLNVNPEKFRPSAVEAATAIQEQGYTVHAVDTGQISQLEPNLRSGLASGLHYPSEAHVHPLKAVLSFARGARARGAVLATGITVRELSMRGSRVASVETTAGTVSPRFVVSATGWTAAWMRAAGVTLPPVRSVIGQLISSDPIEPVLRGGVGGDFLVLQLSSGEIVTGGNLIESEDLTPDPEASRQFADAARELVPRLQNVEFPRAWRGRRPATPDGLPIIDRAPGADNLFLACGHFRNGVLLAPATGKLLAEWLMTDERPSELGPFGAQRFLV
jgi:glycine oxidase